MLVETMYNKLAVNTGFPLYVSETTTPETTRFLLEMLSSALMNTVDNIYISQNVLEKRDRIILVPGQDHYAINGMVKSIQYMQGQGILSGRPIIYNYYIDEPGAITREEKVGPPISYVVDQGEIRLFPVPDKAYEIRVTTSTTDLVWANDDSSRSLIEDIKDSVIANEDFCEIVILRACSYVLLRCNNPIAQFYTKLADDRLKTFIERDSNSFEKPHLYNPIKGHYNAYNGLTYNNFPPRLGGYDGFI